MCQGNDARLWCRLLRRIDNPASLTSCHPPWLIRVILPCVSALTHRTAQFFEMTDPQIFAFLVMPFLFVLTCGMVFFSRERPQPRATC